MKRLSTKGFFFLLIYIYFLLILINSNSLLNLMIPSLLIDTHYQNIIFLNYLTIMINEINFSILTLIINLLYKIKILI